MAAYAETGYQHGAAQDEALATWEPSIDRPPAFRPDLVMIELAPAAPLGTRRRLCNDSRTQTNPTALKLVKGNPENGRCRRPRQLSPCLNRRPPFLCDDAKVEWGRVCSALYAAGLMTELDRAALAAYCAAYGRWAQAERAINRMAARTN